MNQDFYRHSYDEVTKKYFTDRFSKFQLISFAVGFGAGLLYRVLAHNKKYYWEDNFSEIETPQRNMGPLDWPDHDIGYKTQPNMRDEKGNFVAKNPLQQRLTVVHIGCYQLPSLHKKTGSQDILPDDDIKEVGLQNIFPQINLLGFSAYMGAGVKSSSGISI